MPGEHSKWCRPAFTLTEAGFYLEFFCVVCCFINLVNRFFSQKLEGSNRPGAVVSAAVCEIAEDSIILDPDILIFFQGSWHADGAEECYRFINAGQSSFGIICFCDTPYVSCETREAGRFCLINSLRPGTPRR